MKSPWRRAAAGWLVMGVLSCSQLALAQTCGSDVPATYLDLCNTVTSDIAAFNGTLNGLWNGSRYPVLYTGALWNADANAGLKLINSGYFTAVQTQLQALKAMGVQAIIVEVGFPMLYEPFFSSSDQYQQFVNFYSQVAAAVRGMGLKLIVENQCLAVGIAQAGWGSQLTQFYTSLDWDQYQAARAQTAQVIAQTMQPDYMAVLEEPDTEALMSGQANVNTVSGAISMLDQLIPSAQQAGVLNLKVGAGVGTWLPGFQGFIDGFTGQQCSDTQPCVTTPLDFIDMHIFPTNNWGPPVSNDFLANALTIINMAAAAGKPVTMAQTWPWKVRNSEWNVLTNDQIMARNAFSFWAPLDAYFLQTMENLANYAQMLFMVPFDTQDFSAYLTYTPDMDYMTPAQIYSMESTQSAAAMQQAAFTTTGMSYYYSLVSPPDTIPPSMPANLTGVSGSPTGAYISWSPSSDNVGVAGYHIWRNGVQLPNTAYNYVLDSGLTQNTRYTYVVAAFDLGGNMSTTAAVTVTTQNGTAPNPPTNVAGVSESGQEITLTWTPPTGTAPLTSYLLFRGTSPANLARYQQLAATATSFKNYHLAPSTTYCYGLESAAKGLISVMSNVVCVTTLAGPSQPGDVVATASSSTLVKVTWSASTGGLPIAAYHVYRGTSPDNVTQQVALTTNTFYNDRTVSPMTTYYYAVQASDTGGLQSPRSAIASVTTP
jgi:hypothetical protein